MRWRRLCVATMVALVSGATAAQQPHRTTGTSTPDVVVTGSRGRPSAWREAETDHVILQSDGSEAELVRLARNLERLHFLLSGLTGRVDAPDATVKLRITLIGDVPEFQALDLRNWRWQQGPFNDLFTLTRYYDPRADGAVMATTRVDQITRIEHSTITPEQLQGVLAGANLPGPDSTNTAQQAAVSQALVGDFATGGLRGPHDLVAGDNAKSIPVTAESLLYAGYAQHYLLTYFPAAYPRWYLDGFGQIFASLVVRGDNVMEFGRSPKGASAVLNEFGPFPLADILSDKYRVEKAHKTGWTPVHAWLLTHFLFFSDTRRPQLRQYLAARANGADPQTAAAVFGDQRQLARELRAYFGARKPYEQVTYPAGRAEEPVVRRLTEGEAAFVKGRLELGARLVIPPAPPLGTDPRIAQGLQRRHDEAVSQRDRWLQRLHRDADRWTGDLGAQLLLAEAECRSDHAAACLAAAERAEALAPQDARPTTWHGLALALAAAQGPADGRATALAAARRMIATANHRDQEDVEPLLAYYQSYAAAGEAPPLAAIDGLQKVMESVPAAPEPRLALATALADRGQAGAARAVALPVAAGAYDSPEEPQARALLARLGQNAGPVQPAPGEGGATPPGAPAPGAGAPSPGGPPTTTPAGAPTSGR